MAIEKKILIHNTQMNKSWNSTQLENIDWICLLTCYVCKQKTKLEEISHFFILITMYNNKSIININNYTEICLNFRNQIDKYMYSSMYICVNL